MVSNLKISQLYIGKTDAKDELLFANDEEKLLFERTFFVPPHIDDNDYLTGKKFYVLGLKGTGKTAFLRYLDIRARRQPAATTSFILFKSDFSEEERKEVVGSDDSLEIATEALSPGFKSEHDYENVWRWFFHRKIASMLLEAQACPVRQNADFERYVECIMSAEVPGERSGLRRLFPKFTKGQVEISKSPSLKIDFEWSDREKKHVSFSSIVRQADNLFENLQPATGTFTIFVDELEIKLGSKKRFERDARLIRDLVVTAHRFNQMSQSRSRWLKIICAIRTEVLSALVDFGKEIEKPLFDFGSELDWYSPLSREGALHILSQMICFKIHKTETGVGASSSRDLAEIWNKYFAAARADAISQPNLLNRTWFRPRDLVRLLTLCKNKSPDSLVFSKYALDDIMKPYSTQSWREIIAELGVKYSVPQQRAIATLFTQFKQQFTLSDFIRRMHDLTIVHNEVADLARGEYTPADILVDLYRAGAIGNVGPKGWRFAFRHDADLNLSAPMGMHQTLRSHFTQLA